VRRSLLLVNIALGVVGSMLVIGLIREVIAARPLPPPPALRASQPAPASPPAPAGQPAATSAFGVIVTKNLFSPARSEVTVTATMAAAPRPVLHGVMIDGEKSRAYLEDPVAKRVFGYAVGDPIGGGRLQEIGPDHVVIARPEGTVEVLLRDPSKPKPPAPAGSPGVSPAPVTAPAPGVIPAAPGAPAAVVAPAPGSTSGSQVENAPPQSPPTAPAPPPRRPRREE
jgi:hypothetical protein